MPDSMPDPMHVVAHNLRRLRQEANLTQAQLADLAGLDRTFVSLCERCHRNVTVQSLFALANGLGCTPADLVVVAHHGSRATMAVPVDARANPEARIRPRRGKRR